MRKKSHIFLARYIVETVGDENLKKHKLSFYLGSILPDIKPSFLYRRHEMEGTYPDIKRHIKRLSEGNKLIFRKKTGSKYYMDLGQISHYLADYFTFPHNKIYTGNLKEHCSYEKKLRDDLMTYVSENKPMLQEIINQKFENSDILCEFIQRMHDDYLKEQHDVKHDILHIIEVNQCAMYAMLYLLNSHRMACRRARFA